MSMTGADLVLYNANILTMNSLKPRASWVVVNRGNIIAVGSGVPPLGADIYPARAVNCGGGTLIPGFNDAHCHVLATSAASLSVDCTPSAVSSIEEIKEKLRTRAASVPEGSWLRATGYNEFYLREMRHPNKWDLDEVAPQHPIRLIHRSGHAMVLNRRAMELAGIFIETPDPTYGVIEREDQTGEPTGLLLEMNDYLDDVLPRLSQPELEAGIRLFNDRCLSMGITSVQDATPGNDLEQWDLFVGLKKRGLLTPDITFMPGARHIHQFQDQGLHFGYGIKGLRLGAAKVMVTMTTGSLQPPRSELRRLVMDAHLGGFQLAVHAVEAEVVEEVLDAITLCPNRDGSGPYRHRIEHCSECQPYLMERMAINGVSVVTQPSFLYYNGERYRSEVPMGKQPWLYPIRSLLAYGVHLAAGSDAPVAPMDPLIGICAAVTRLAESGYKVNPGQTISVEEAINMYTLGSAYVSFEERVSGSIEDGKRANLVLLDRDPMLVSPEEIKNLRVLMTVIGGEVVWEL